MERKLGKFVSTKQESIDYNTFCNYIMDSCVKLTCNFMIQTNMAIEKQKDSNLLTSLNLITGWNKFKTLQTKVNRNDCNRLNGWKQRCCHRDIVTMPKTTPSSPCCKTLTCPSTVTRNIPNAWHRSAQPEVINDFPKNKGPLASCSPPLTVQQLASKD